MDDPRSFIRNARHQNEVEAYEGQYQLLRLEFIKAAMQGLCTKAAPDYSTGQCNAAIAERAVAVADATLAAAGEKL